MNPGASVSAAPRPQEAGQPPNPRGRILIIEDDRLSREALRLILERSGFEVKAVRTLRDGVDALEWSPRVLLLDLMLPDGGGLSALKCIRSEKLDIRVAVTTAVVDPLLLAEVQRLSPEGFFWKPLDLQKLLAWLAEAGG